jgi:LPXTG-site transpeptidase (sortase) family protein
MDRTGYKPTILQSIRERKRPFFLAFASVFFVTLGVLAAIGATPTLVVEESKETRIENIPAGTDMRALSEEPVRVIAESVDLNDAIANPESADIGVLDQALLKSSVRYPGSAQLNEDGNVLLFGHSSYLRTTINPAYKAFNDIQKLKIGETVKVYSATSVYEYRVTSVRFVKAEEATIDLRREGPRRLTLVTCNSFATKSDRFVVEAEFVRSYPR